MKEPAPFHDFPGAGSDGERLNVVQEVAEAVDAVGVGIDDLQGIQAEPLSDPYLAIGADRG